MITRMSNKLSSFFAANGIIKEADTEVYEYSLEILFSTVINFAAVIIIAVLTKSILITSVYLLGFIPLRLIAGGFHADTHFKCFLVLMCTYSAFLAAVRFLPQAWLFYSVILSVSVTIILIFILAPVEDKNKPVSAEAKRSFKIKSRITVLIYAAVVILLLFRFPGNRIAFSLSLGVLSVALSLLATLIRSKIIKTTLMLKALK